MNEKVKVSVVIPCFNVEKYINECLTSVCNQTYRNIEIICIDDGSTDSTVSLLKTYSEKDSRILVYTQDNKGAGAVRNIGIEKAEGDYLYFCDSDDICEPELLEKCIKKAEETGADIVAFNTIRFEENGNTLLRNDVHVKFLPKDKNPFNYQDCPNKIMGIINPTPWNKFYNASFVKKNGLKFEEISSTNDITFSSVSLASAKKIAYFNDVLYKYRWGEENTITSTKSYKMMNVVQALTSAERQVKKLPYFEEIRNGMYQFVIENYLHNFRNFLRDFEIPSQKDFYISMRETFCSEDYLKITREDLDNDDLYGFLLMVQNTSVEQLEPLLRQKMVVSLTTFPQRIAGISQVINVMLKQTIPADLIVLNLAKEEFKNERNDLPNELVELEQNGKLLINFVDDNLKPHNKYYYAMQAYPDSIIVTIDDDILYNTRLLERLRISYYMYPKAVSTARTHYILHENNEILPYEYWVKTQSIRVNQPNHQLLATGVGGVLYPPHIFNNKVFDKDVIKRTCLKQDDIWLKVFEWIDDVPVVLVHPYEGLKYIPGSQEFGLWQNVNQKIDIIEKSQNDISLENVLNWAKNEYGDISFILDKILGKDRKEDKITLKEFGKYSITEISKRQTRIENFTKDIAKNKDKIKGLEEKIKKYEKTSNPNQRLENDSFNNKKLLEELHILQLEFVEEQRRNKEFEQKLCSFKTSKTWKIGKIITFIPRKIKSFLKK